jgi:hypothetical protein
MVSPPWLHQKIFFFFFQTLPQTASVFLPRVINYIEYFCFNFETVKSFRNFKKTKTKQKNTVKTLIFKSDNYFSQKSADQVQTIDSSEIKLDPTIQGGHSQNLLKQPSKT